MNAFIKGLSGRIGNGKKSSATSQTASKERKAKGGLTDPGTVE